MITGSCICQNIQYRIDGLLHSQCYCHCESCRKASGAPFMAWGTIEKDHFEVTSGKLTLIKSSTDAERGFCGKCGASISYSHTLRTEEIDVTLATLNNSSTIKPESHIWVQDKPPWVQIGDDLPQYQTAIRLTPDKS